MTADRVTPETPERAAVAALADDFLMSLREWITIPSISTDPAHHGDVARSAHWLADGVVVGEESFGRGAGDDKGRVAMHPHATLGVPVVYLGATLPDDRTHAPNERVVLPLPLRGAEAAARLWRSLPERLS